MYGASFETDKGQAPYRNLHKGLFCEGVKIIDTPRSSRHTLRPRLRPVGAAYLAVPDREIYSPETEADVLWLLKGNFRARPERGEMQTLGKLVKHLTKNGDVILATTNDGPRMFNVRGVPDAGEQYTDTMMFYKVMGELTPSWNMNKEWDWVTTVRQCWQ